MTPYAGAAFSGAQARSKLKPMEDCGHQLYPTLCSVKDRKQGRTRAWDSGTLVDKGIPHSEHLVKGLVTSAAALCSVVGHGNLSSAEICPHSGVSWGALSPDPLSEGRCKRFLGDEGQESCGVRQGWEEPPSCTVSLTPFSPPHRGLESRNKTQDMNGMHSPCSLSRSLLASCPP